MNEEDIVDSFSGTGNVIASDIVRAMSYLHSRDIVDRDIKPANVLVSNFHNKSYKHKELEIVFGKKPIVCKLSDFWEARSMYSQIYALTSKNYTTALHRGSLAFMAPELIIEELSIASAGIDELKTVDVWAVLMTFFTILNPDQSYPLQNDLENIPYKELQIWKQLLNRSYRSKLILPFSLKYLNKKMTHHCN